MADTIMMTSSTSTTSTMGVTLMPTIGARLPPRAVIVPAMCFVSFPFPPSVGFDRRHGPEAAFAADAGRFRRLRLRGQISGAPLGFEKRRHILRDRRDVALDVADALLHQVVRDDRGDRDEEAHA